MTNKIEVTRQDIGTGAHLSPCFCPLALAAKRAFPGHEVIVGLDSIRVYESSRKGTSIRTIPLSDEAQAWQARFDSGRPVEPISIPVEG